MKIFKILFAVGLLAIVGASCSDDKKDEPKYRFEDIPANWLSHGWWDYYLPEDGTYTIYFDANKFEVPHEGGVINIPLLLGQGDDREISNPYPLYEDSYTEQERTLMDEVYNHSAVTRMDYREYYGKDNYKDFDISFEQKSDNCWEGDGIKVEKVYDGKCYSLQITVPQNPLDKERSISIYWTYLRKWLLHNTGWRMTESRATANSYQDYASWSYFVITQE